MGLFKTLGFWLRGESFARKSKEVKELRKILKASTSPLKAELGIKKLENAIDEAESAIRPSRLILYSIYKQVARDGEIFSHMRTTRNKMRRAPFKLYDKLGKEVEKAKELLQRPWFGKYTELWTDTVFWGHSLVEFSAKADNEYKDVWIIPREHVHPWSKQVVINTTDTKGIPYLEKPWADSTIEIGSNENLGLLLIAAKEAIYKKYSRSDWSRYAEKFGMPTVHIKTSTTDNAELDRMERMAANIGTNGYIITDDEDELNLLLSGSTDAYKVYLELCNYCDKQISKIISGQTGTSNEKAFVGSSEVHERIFEDYILALLTDFQDHINYTLIPFLVSNGYKLEGHKLQFLDLRPKHEEKKQLEKKKLACSCKKEKFALSKQLVNLDELMAKAIENTYKQKSKRIDTETWLANTKKLQDAIDKGSAISYGNIDFGDRGYETMTALRHNAGVFAAFKNHQQQASMLAALRDDNGYLRTFEEFSQEAASIYKQYNQNWLETEYNTAIGTAQMALQWEDFQANSDIFPMLQYEAVQDERTRSGHAELHGTTLYINDPFWGQFFPPNGFNCRCTVRQVSEQKEVKPKNMPSNKEVDAAFRFNPGDGNLFSSEHKYYNVSANTYREIVKELQALEFSQLDGRSIAKNSNVIPDTMKTLSKLAERKYLGLDKKTGGFVAVMEGHTMDKATLKNELSTAAILKGKGYGVILRDERNKNTIDAQMNGKLYEMKAMKAANNPKKRMREHLEKAKKQGANNIIMHLQQDVSQAALVDSIWSSGRLFNEIILIISGGVKTLRMRDISSKGVLREALK